MGIAKKKRVRRSEAESKDRIIDEVLKVVAKEGWSGLSFQKIAKRCKISTSNVVYHFESRDSLLVALLDRISANNFAIVAEDSSIEDNAYKKILNHFQKNIEWGKRHPEEAQIVIQIYLEAAHNPKFSPTFVMMIDRAQERIREHVLAGTREGLFKPILDSKVVARVIHNALIGAFIYVMGTRINGVVETSPKDWEVVLKSILGYKA